MCIPEIGTVLVLVLLYTTGSSIWRESGWRTERETLCGKHLSPLGVVYGDWGEVCEALILTAVLVDGRVASEYCW